MSLKKAARLLCLLLFILFSGSVSGQNVNLQNLKSVNIDDLNDDQVRQIILKLDASKMSMEDLEVAAISQGLSRTDIQKLRERIEKVKRSGAGMGTAAKAAAQKTSSSRTVNQDALDSVRQNMLKRDTALSMDQILSDLKPKIYGADIFRNANPSFEPNLRMATPKDYPVGPDDQLVIEIYGNSEVRHELTVSPDGTINIPNVGIVAVGGMTIEQATSKVRSRMSQIYTALKTGGTSLTITLGNIRSIKVLVTGDVKAPGSVTLPSVATAFNALYLSGGPTENGSFRAIEVIRAGKKISTIDLYDFLQTGLFKGLQIRLQDQDVIRVPTYKKRVQVVGEVKRPGLFELLPGEKFSDLLQFAGDFNERAFQERIKVVRNTTTQLKIEDITMGQFNAFEPSTGDKFFIKEILERFQNRVTIEGAVFHPGEYELKPGMTLKALLQNAEGLREDAFKNLAYIVRQRDDLQATMLNVDLNRIISGADPDVPLQREDIVQVSSIFGLKEYYTVQITGEVQRPQVYNFAEGMTLQDLIVIAGGLKESATTQSVEISRRVKNSDVSSLSAKTADIVKVDITADLRSQSSKIILQPFDIVSIRASSGYSKQRLVTVEGEVLAPGKYTIASKDERISDMIKRVQGFTAQAYLDGASLKRVVLLDTTMSIKEDGKDQSAYKLEQMKKAQGIKKRQLLDSAGAEREILDFIPNDFVGINLPKIMENPGGREDIFLEDGDILYVPKQLQTVKVSGQVLSPSTIIFAKSRGFAQYIANAGGFSTRALKKSSYIIYANGSVASTRKVLFFRNYPIVKPGAEIVVPVKSAKKGLSAAELVGITSGLASLGAIVLGVLNLSN